MGMQRDIRHKTNQMNRDFTLRKYEDLCRALTDTDYSFRTVREYLENPQTTKRIAILRHDVDRKINNALRMAELEQTFGIHSTYYFRYPYTFRPDIIIAIRDMGHEIGYHHETLSKAKGDPEKAIVLFENELRSFRLVTEIRTICMHGSPLSPYDNRDLWKKYDFRNYDILGEASQTVKGTHYLSETGRSWSGKNSLRDESPESKSFHHPVETTVDLIGFIKSQNPSPIYLTVHPERWALTSTEWFVWMLADCAMNTGKKIIRILRF